MLRDYRLYLDDILDAIKQINEYIAGYDKEAFSKDRKTLDAVIRNLEIIGEAAGHLPEDIRNITPHMEWRKIVGLRNILIHEYFGINVHIIWDVITNKLEPLRVACLTIMEHLDNTLSDNGV